jgi:hypothetical protein
LNDLRPDIYRAFVRGCARLSGKCAYQDTWEKVYVVPSGEQLRLKSATPGF